MPQAFGTGLKVVALLALLASCGLPDDVGQRRAESHGEDACLPLGCNHIVTAPLYDAGPFTPDRRPVAVLQLWGGNYACGDTGNAPWYTDRRFVSLPECDGTSRAEWEDDGCVRRACTANGNPLYKEAWAGDGKPDVWNKMEEELNEIRGYGFLRIVFNRPAGRYDADKPAPPDPAKDYPPSSQYWPLEEEHLDMWKIVQPDGKSVSLLQEWADSHPDVQLGIYTGYRIHDPCSLWGYTAGHHLPNPWDPDDMCVAAQNILGWARPKYWGSAPEYKQVQEFWMDNTSSQDPDYDGGPIAPRDSFIAFSRSQTWKGLFGTDLKFVGEAIPWSVLTPTHYELDERYVTKSAWTQRLQTFEQRARTGDGSPLPADVSENVPNMTGVSPRELHVIFQPCSDFQPCAEEIDVALVTTYIQRGYIPAAWHTGTNGASNLSTLYQVATACRMMAGLTKAEPLTRCSGF